MLQNNCELRILVKGKPVTEYPHQGQFYIEGREASEFELEFRNGTATRVMAILSVDGISVVDGKEAGVDSTGYLVNARETLRIPGWTLSTGQVAKFFFAGKDVSGDKSYVAQSGGDTRNKGVIGVLVYGEKQRQMYRGINISAGSSASGQSLGTYDISRFYSGNAGTMSGSLPQNGIIGQSLNNVSPTMSSSNAKSAPRGIAPGVSAAETDSSYTASATAAPEVTQSLGTGFGSATEFKTTMVNFERGDLVTMMVLYYDDRKGLRQRGIEIVRPSRQKYVTQPQAFPGMACKPPPGWQG